MRAPAWTLLGSTLFLVFAAPARGFFDAFSDIQNDIEMMEQGSPGSLDDILKDLESFSPHFTDVSSADWFYQYVSSAARWGIVSGYKDAAGKPTGVFGPGNGVTVAEILKMALKAAQVDETACTGALQFAQAANHWARPFVLCAQERDMRILASNPDLNRPALRAEVLGVVFDAFGDRVPPLFAPFEDTANHPLEADVAYAAALNIVSGDTDSSGRELGTFRPDDGVNRAEAAKIVYERLRVEVMGEMN